MYSVLGLATVETQAQIHCKNVFERIWFGELCYEKGSFSSGRDVFCTLACKVCVWSTVLDSNKSVTLIAASHVELSDVEVLLQLHGLLSCGMVLALPERKKRRIALICCFQLFVEICLAQGSKEVEAPDHFKFEIARGTYCIV